MRRRFLVGHSTRKEDVPEMDCLPIAGDRRACRAESKERGGTWDPTRPSASSRTYESGRATYSLDSSGIVHLSMRSKVGAERHMAGPMPQQLLDSESRRRQRTLTRSLVLGYGVLLLAGFVVGYLLATGSVAGRLLVGLAGAFVGMIVVSLAALMLRVASSVRDLHRGSS